LGERLPGWARFYQAAVEAKDKSPKLTRNTARPSKNDIPGFQLQKQQAT